MQYFNAIHCDRNISTSELKNPFAVSPRIQQLLRICVRPQSAHLCCIDLQCTVRAERVIVDKRAVRIRLVCLTP